MVFNSVVFRRIQEGAQFAAKMENQKRYNQKLEKQLKSLKKYLSELPTRDEYKNLMSEKSRLLDRAHYGQAYGPVCGPVHGL